MTESKPEKYGTVHGGRGAIKRIQEGKPMVGLAKIAQDDVLDRLAADGVEGELQRNAIRLQVVSDLYFAALTKVLQDGDHEKATEYLSKWGWITNSAVRAWQVAMKMQPKDDGKDITEVLATYRGTSTESPEGKNEQNN